MKDNHEMDDLFSFEGNEKNIITKAKRKSTLRIASISGLVSFLVLILVILLKLQVTPWLLNKEIIAQDQYYDVYGANTFIGPWEESIRIIGSNATAPQYKLLDGQPVYRGEISNDSNHIEVHLSPNRYETYNYFGGKVMNFLHPEVLSAQIPNEVQTIDAFREQQLIEVGLSFDKGYSLAEVQSMLPEELTLQWAWVETYSKGAIESLQASDPPSHMLTENEVIGFSLTDETGAPVQEPEERFIESVKSAKDQKGRYQKEMASIYDGLSKSGSPEIKIIGAVVVGTKQELQQLQNASYIRASSIGAVADTFN
ncbi:MULTISPECIES: anti sigma factor C-terminal domain-containing protein [Sporosarcina]|uniref:anti sigma factor C-terminal domain-containing protein n=1 Tax=Sporosarcina TaxID=1569 RepID=UPI00129A8245|nr:MULTISPECIES: anti sigma factor C-terminal domain-containing protein [Sporosarcina]GKV67418.1 hypothetical protein NCCP2331_35710 [Sporosarcina sp. NCCP-2331]GLB57774.1 hypothetical protein NCCP2378_35650 [Sporosarcina sp. NCCP-2378]